MVGRKVGIKKRQDPGIVDRAQDLDLIAEALGALRSCVPRDLDRALLGTAGSAIDIRVPTVAEAFADDPVAEVSGLGAGWHSPLESQCWTRFEASQARSLGRRSRPIGSMLLPYALSGRGPLEHRGRVGDP